MTIPRNIPEQVDWSEVENFEDFDTRRSAVDCLYANTIGVSEGFVEWCPDDTRDENVYCCWVWSVRPSLSEEVKKHCDQDLRELIEAYESDEMDAWFESA